MVQTRRDKAGLPSLCYKGQAENAPLAGGFPRVSIFRPAYIYPVEPRREPNLSYRHLRAVYPVFRRCFRTRQFARLGRLTDAARLSLVFWSRFFDWKGSLAIGVNIYAANAFEVLTTLPAASLHDLLTIFLSTAGSGGILNVINGTGGSSTIANPDMPVTVVSYP